MRGTAKNSGNTKDLLSGKVAVMVFTQKKQFFELKQVRYIFPLKGFGENHSFTIASSEKVCVGWVGPPTPKNNLAFTVGFCTDN